MSQLDLVPADSASFAALIDAVNRGYEGYVGEFAPETVASYEEYVREQDVDLNLSLLARDEQGVGVGLALLARRGDLGWIGDFAVAPQWRGRGEGRRLLDLALERCRAAGITTVRLEVDPKNKAARKLYSNAGFVETRRLHNFGVIGLRAGQWDGTITTATLSAIAEALASDGVRPAWDHDMPALIAATPTSQLLAAAQGGEDLALALARRRDDEIDLLYFGVTPRTGLQAGRALLAALGVADTVVRLSYVPDNHPLLRVLPALGFRENSQDIEMEARLAG